MLAEPAALCSASGLATSWAERVLLGAALPTDDQLSEGGLAMGPRALLQGREGRVVVAWVLGGPCAKGARTFVEVGGPKPKGPLHLCGLLLWQ